MGIQRDLRTSFGPGCCVEVRVLICEKVSETIKHREQGGPYRMSVSGMAATRATREELSANNAMTLTIRLRRTFSFISWLIIKSPATKMWLPL